MREGRPAPPAGDDYPVVVEEVTKRYGGHVVVRNLSFVARPGRVTGFLGPNGSGKSTAMKIMLGLAAADEGRVLIGDRDVDGSKGFVATAADQRSLVAFGGNAMIIGALFGAVAVAREYAHNTVIPTFISTPKRLRVVAAQAVAVAGGGTVIGIGGGALSVSALAVALPGTGFGFLVATPDVLRLLAAAGFCGAAGALLGAGVGAAVRNPGGAVAGTVLALVIAPPLVAQLIDGAARWVPSSLAVALSGVPPEAAAVPSQTGPAAAAAALALWGLLPVATGSVLVMRRDVT